MAGTIFYHNEVIDPLKELRDDLGTKHTNTFIPKVLAEARNYELTEDEDSRKLSGFFWHTMIDRHTFAPGCSSDKEHYFDPDHFSKHISGYTGETCCTYNMLKLSSHLFCWTADAAVADYYERALYNHILGQQDPHTGMVTYFYRCFQVHIKCTVPRKILSGVVWEVVLRTMLNMEKLFIITMTKAFM